MLELVESKDNKFITDNNLLEKSIDSSVYVLKLNDSIIGYGIVKNANNDNKIYIHILEDYQSNGYGTYLFKELLKKVNKKLEFRINRNNYKMNRIIYRCGGYELIRKEDVIIYSIPAYKD